MRPKGTAAELERRRRRAVELVERGESPSLVARLFDVHATSIHRWRRQARSGQGLQAKPLTGLPPRLSAEQLVQLEALLRQGAKAHGWPNELWTAARVARLIERHFGVKHHPEHVRKILKRRLGWTSQKPRRKARECKLKEVERWLGDELPRIIREAFRRRAHVAFLDESGFYLTPCVRRTLAPRGQTPVLTCWDRRDRLSAISCITLSPRVGRPDLHFRLLAKNETVHGEDVVAFLRQLRRQLRGPFTVVWDRHKIHSKSRVVQAYLAEHPDIVAEDLPAYAPEANPDEWVWSWSKYGRLSNLAAQDTDELWDHVVMALNDLKFQRNVLDGFVQDARASLTG
jgi:transposase